MLKETLAITTLISFSLNKFLRRTENKSPNMVVGNVAGLCLTLSLFHFNWRPLIVHVNPRQHCASLPTRAFTWSQQGLPIKCVFPFTSLPLPSFSPSPLHFLTSLSPLVPFSSLFSSRFSLPFPPFSPLSPPPSASNAIWSTQRNAFHYVHIKIRKEIPLILHVSDFWIILLFPLSFFISAVSVSSSFLLFRSFFLFHRLLGNTKNNFHSQKRWRV